MQKYKTIIVDDHRLFRKGISMLLKEMDFIDLVAEADDGQHYMEIIETIHPDIVLMDIRMPRIDGFEAAKRTLEKYPDVKILVVSMFSDSEYYQRMLGLGVRGFIIKESDYEEFKHALESVAQGKTYFSQEILVNLVKNYHIGGQSTSEKLSKREIEILDLLCQGLSTPEIAEKLFISQRTVESHRSNLLSKTNTKNSIQLVIYAIKQNLFKI